MEFNYKVLYVHLVQVDVFRILLCRDLCVTLIHSRIYVLYERIMSEKHRNKKELLGLICGLFFSWLLKSRHHHNHHQWGPHFEENPVNVTVREGESTHLDCRVGLIEDKLVSLIFLLPFTNFTFTFTI